MNKHKLIIIQRAIAVIGIGFGLLTIVIGVRTLLGYSDPGYVIFLPLLIFNIGMGLVYTGSGVIIWSDLDFGVNAAKIVFMINLGALFLIFLVYLSGGAVATESLKAMSIRTIVWLLLWCGLLWLRK